MQTQTLKMFPTLETTIEKTRQLNISEKRIQVLSPLIDQGKEVNLNFICTHNSRRSLFSQIWAQTAESARYDERSMQIASELFYEFSKVKMAK